MKLMAKMKTLVIMRGNDTVTIARGEPFIGDMRKSTTIKHKGIFGKKVILTHIPDIFISQPKKLCSNDKIVDGWEVVEVSLDYLTREPCLTDISPALHSKILSLEKENAALKAQCVELNRHIMTNAMEEKNIEYMKKKFKQMNDIKVAGYPAGDGFGFSPFGFRGGVPPSGGD